MDEKTIKKLTIGDREVEINYNDKTIKIITESSTDSQLEGHTKSIKTRFDETISFKNAKQYFSEVTTNKVQFAEQLVELKSHNGLIGLKDHEKKKFEEFKRFNFLASKEQELFKLRKQLKDVEAGIKTNDGLLDLWTQVFKELETGKE